MRNGIIIVSCVFAFLALSVPIFLSWKLRGWVSKYDSPNYGFDDIPNLQGKFVIVTGANTGIGKVTVRELARKGAHVILASRSQSKGLAAKSEICNVIGSGCNIDVLELDLSSLSSVRSFFHKVNDLVKSIDILILNAGVMMCPYGVTKEGYELQWGTNHLGHFYLVHLLMPLLESGHARVVHVSSSAHRNTYPDGVAFDQLKSDKGYDMKLAYGQSKISNILFSNELAHRLELRNSTISSNSLHPGVIRTDLGRHIVETMGDMAGAMRFVVDMLFEVFMSTVAMDADAGALTQLFVGTSPLVSGVNGKFFHPIALQTTTTELAQSKELQRKLWEVSEKYIAEFENM